MATKEDLAHTPAERAAAAAKAAAGLGDEAALFAEAEEVPVGELGTVLIVGAGLVGSLLAVVLLRKGFKVKVFERYPDIRSIPSLGRSINLSVTSRGLRAVRALGGSLYDDVLKITTEIRGRIIHPPGSASASFMRYGKDDSECNYSISRVELNKLLIGVAAEDGAEYHFNHGLSDTSDFAGEEPIGSVLNFTVGVGDAATRVRMRANCPVIACDGGGSRVRYAIRRLGLTSFTEEMMDFGYKEVLFPNPGEAHFGAEECHGRYGLHIWPRGDHFLMALANVDGSFTGTIYMNKTGGPLAFDQFTDSAEGRETCTKFCEEHYSEAAPLVGGMERLVEQICSNPVGILGTVKCQTWAVKGKVLLIGDASHAMVPFFGQGCNCGFEDTLVLSRLLDAHCCEGGRCVPEKCTGDNFAAVFEACETARKPNALAICQMAIENAAEMGDKSGNMTFQLMKKVENRLENAFGDKFRSRYAMVCYGGDGNVSYANAQALGVVQEKILLELCTGVEGLDSDEAVKEAAERIDLDKAMKLIDEQLVPLQKEMGIDLSTVKH